jgi:hypothetical protein
MKRKALVTSICAIMICALAAAVADFAITGRARPASKHFATCCMTVHSTTRHSTGVTWISAGAQQPKFQWQRAEALLRAKSGQISVPFLGQLGQGLFGSLTSPGTSTQGTAPYVHPNVWDEGGCPTAISARPGHRAVPGTGPTLSQPCPGSRRVTFGPGGVRIKRARGLRTGARGHGRHPGIPRCRCAAPRGTNPPGGRRTRR